MRGEGCASDRVTGVTEGITGRGIWGVREGSAVCLCGDIIQVSE